MRFRRAGRVALAAVMASVLVAEGALADTTLDTSTDLNTSVSTPSSVAVGANTFTVRVWGANGNVPGNKTGKIDIVTTYSMATTGVVSPVAGSTVTRTMPTTPCTGAASDPLGCPNNPFVVTATLNVAAGTANGTTGQLRVVVNPQSNSGVNVDATPAEGYVRVGAANAAPTVGSITGATAQNEGATGSYAVSATDADGDALTYAWSTTGNATISGAANTASAFVVFGDGASTATVSVAVDDLHGHVVNRSTTVAIGNVAPSAVLVAPTTVNEGSPIAVALTDPSDPSAADRTAGFTYAFDCGSGYGATTATASISCGTTDDGSRTVKARVTDKDGGASEYTAAVTVANVAPTATFSPSSPVDEGSDITLAFLGVTDPSPVDTAAGFTYAFDCGSGFGAFGGSSTASCPTDDNGTRTVQGAVRDKDGGTTTYTVTTVEVDNVAPTALFETTGTVAEGTSIPLALTGADDPSSVDEASLTYVFDCGSGYGATGTVSAVTCATDDQGSRTVKGKVLDKDGGFTEYTQVVTVTNVAPIATFGAPSSVDEGSPISLSLSNVQDPSSVDEAAGFTYAFDCGSGYGAASTSATVSCPTSDEGTRTVKGKVLDKDGGFTEYAQSVSIANVAPVVAAGGAAALDEGDTLTRAGSFTDPGSDDWTATVAYGDGSSTETVSIVGTTFTLGHVYEQDGEFVVTVVVSDGTDASSATFTVDVANVAPDVALTGGTAPEGTTLTASGSFTDPGADDWSATVDYGDGGGATTLTIAADDSFQLAHTYADDGTYTLTVAVSDDDTTSITTATAVVTNGAPIVDAGPDLTVLEGAETTQAVSFTDLGADTWSATIDYGDGSTGAVTLGTDTSFELAHTYADDGTYTVTVSVTDDDDGTGTDSFVVEVANVVPVVDAGADQGVKEGEAFSGAGSFLDPGADEWSATVDYGDGSGTTTLTIADDKTFELGHTYADNGVYTVTVSVSDGDAAVPSTSTATVTVTNVGPTVDAGPGATIDEGDTFAGGGSFSDPGADAPWTATVNYGDGAAGSLDLSGSTFSLSHRYTDEGTYLAVVTVTDKDGAPGSGSTTVTVNNVAPTVDAGADTAIDEGGTFTRHGTFADPGADDWSATVDYGDGTTASVTIDSKAFDLSHVYTQDGSYTVVVTVDDGDGGVSTDDVVVTVRNVAPVVSAGGDESLDEGGVLSRSGSFTDPGADTWSATVDYGDGTTSSVSLSGTTFGLNHQYVQDGVYDVTVSVDDGTTSSVGMFVVTVNNVAPTVSVFPGAAAEGSTLTVTGSFVDPGADTWAGTVDFGDGTTGTVTLGADNTFSFDHVYADNGSYTVVVAVADDDTTGSGDGAAVVTNVDPALGTIADLAAFEGSAAQTTATFSDPGADTWSASVDYGDGSAEETLSSVGTSFPLSHVYADDGTYVVTVAVTDDDGGSASTTFSVVVANVTPNVNAGANGATAEGSAFTSSGSFSDPGADTWSATVDYGDGSGVQPLALSDTAFALSHTYVDNGVYVVTVEVDDGSDTGTSTATVTVSNVAPTVDAGPGASIDEGAAFTSSGSVSDPSSADTFTASVDYDGTGATSLTVHADRTFDLSHLYVDDGVFHPTVIAVDDDGDAGSDATTVTVHNVAPSVVVGSASAVDEGSAFTVAGSFTDPGADSWTVAAVYGDGTAPQAVSTSGTAFTLSHVYADDGVYTATATVTDDDGGVGAATTTATVRNVAPTVSAGADANIDEGDAFTGSGSFTDPGADTWTAQVDYGDGSGWQPLAVTGMSFSLSHSYAQDGVYKVTVKVHDGDDHDVDSLSVTVDNVAPAVTVNAIAPVDEGSPASISGSFVDPGADSWSATVDYGDGTTGTVSLTAARTFSLSHTYVQDGAYDVVVRVSDGSDEGSRSASATVRNVRPTVSTLQTSTDSATACLAGTSAGLRFSVTDPGVADPTTSTISWGDGAVSVLAGRTVTTSHSFAAGSWTIAVSATDEKGTGNTSTASVSNLYTTSGILQPINADGTSVFKKGSTVPVKIRVADCAGTPVGNLSPEVQLRKVGAAVGGTVEVVSTSAADTGQWMRWDAAAAQYIYNLSTKRSTFNGGYDLSDGQYELKIRSSAFADIVVRFTLKA